MGKKNEIKKIAPSLCMESLKGFHEASYWLNSMIPEIIKYIEEAPTHNQPLKDFIIKNVKERHDAVNAFYVYE